MSLLKKDIIYIYSGWPLPSMLDLPRFCSNHSKSTSMMVIDRGENIEYDQGLINFEVYNFSSNFHKTNLFLRLLNLIKISWKIYSYLFRNTKRNSVVCVNTFDILLVVAFYSLFLRFRIFYQVRDLHRIQLEDTLLSSFVRFIEKICLKRAHCLILSSEGFYLGYYKKLFHKKTIILENFPIADAWNLQELSKDKLTTEIITIGFIGLLRYPKSLLSLVRTVNKLNEKNFRFKIQFSGSDYSNIKDMLLEEAADTRYLEFTGAYNYSSEIQKLYNSIDINYCVYDSFDKNCRLAMPNKFYESILTETPIIVAKDTYLADRVEELGIGVSCTSGDDTKLFSLLNDLFESRENWHLNSKLSLSRMVKENMFLNYEKNLTMICNEI